MTSPGSVDQAVLARARREAMDMPLDRLRELLLRGPEGLAPELWAVLVEERERRRRLPIPRDLSDDPDPGAFSIADVDVLLVGGGILLLGGVIWLIRALTMDVSVETWMTGIRVVNLGRMNSRLVQAIVAGVVTMLGGLLLGVRLLRRR